MENKPHKNEWCNPSSLNNYMVFHRELLNEKPKERPFFKFVKEYHERCDSYDLEICPPDGTPRNTKQLIMINRNAKEVIKDIANKMFLLGLGSSVFACELLLREAISVISIEKIK